MRQAHGVPDPFCVQGRTRLLPGRWWMLPSKLGRRCHQGLGAPGKSPAQKLRMEAQAAALESWMEGSQCSWGLGPLVASASPRWMWSGLED